MRFPGPRHPRSGGARLVGAAIVLALVVAACSNDHDTSANRRDVYRNLADTVITPIYERFDTTATALATAAAAACADPSPATISAARSAWEDAWQAWNRTKAFRFGPLTTARSVSDIAFMVDPEKIDAVLAGSEPAVGPPFTEDSLGAAGADVRGLAAVEHLLFEQEPTDADTCAYAAAASALVADEALDARVAWTEGADGEAPFAEQLATPGNGAYADSQAVLDDLVNGMAMALTEATKELADAEAAPPGERDTVGGHGGDRVRDTLWSVRAAYDGTLDGSDGDGVGDLVAGVDPAADERVRTILDRAMAAVDSLPTDLDTATPADIDGAYLRVRSLGTIIRAEVASILGVTLSLSDSDGDS